MGGSYFVDFAREGPPLCWGPSAVGVHVYHKALRPHREHAAADLATGDFAAAPCPSGAHLVVPQGRCDGGLVVLGNELAEPAVGACRLRWVPWSDVPAGVKLLPALRDWIGEHAMSRSPGSTAEAAGCNDDLRVSFVREATLAKVPPLPEGSQRADQERRHHRGLAVRIGASP